LAASIKPLFVRKFLYKFGGAGVYSMETWQMINL
jgi:hypothetical protein